MIIARTNKLVTLFGGLAVLGGIPEAVTRAGIKMPLVWNTITPWLSLCGIVFTALAFWAAKGADNHSTVAQIEAATIKKDAEAVVKKADEPHKDPTEVAIVEPIDPAVLKSPDAAAAEIERLRALVAAKEK